MSLEDLFEGRFQRYFDELLSRPPLWLFVHIPKTAGSSLNGELVPILSPNHHIFIDYKRLDQFTFEELMEDAVSRFIDLANKRKYAYCTGHLNAGHVTRITGAVADVRPMTLLRDPVARFVSDYRYQCSTMNVGHEQFRASHPTIESYLELPGEWNKASVHLIPYDLRRAGNAQACVDYILANFAVVGIQEAYALSLRLITTLAGSPRRPGVFRRVNTPTAETAVFLSQPTQALIRERNALDIAIYEAFAAKFRAIQPGLAAYLDQINPLLD
jgi:hypothetical protein